MKINVNASTCVKKIKNPYGRFPTYWTHEISKYSAHVLTCHLNLKPMGTPRQSLYSEEYSRYKRVTGIFTNYDRLYVVIPRINVDFVIIITLHSYCKLIIRFLQYNHCKYKSTSFSVGFSLYRQSAQFQYHSNSTKIQKHKFC